jgi:hypothetical protein
LISYNHVKRKYDFGVDNSDLCLLSAKDLNYIFTDSRIIKSKITFMAETLIVFGGQIIKENSHC